MHNLHPCTIVNDRYGGAYSGHEWLAFYCDRDYVPDAIGGGDNSEMNFWDGHKEFDLPLVAGGETPDQAAQSLYVLLSKYRSL